MKITAKFLHIPPYLSTSWMNIKAIYLHGADRSLVIDLINGSSLAIPDLSKGELDSIFSGYASFLESNPPSPVVQITPIQSQQEPRQQAHGPLSGIQFGDQLNLNTVRLNMEGMGSIQSVMQHDSTQSNNPNIPDEILQKIAQIAKIVAPDDIENMPKPEPHCNCTHCQIARAVHGEPSISLENNTSITHSHEESVADEELNFQQQWGIQQIGDQLYSVTNRLDVTEKYNVFLGSPVGCTCGQSGCEHIIAVLNS